MSSHSEKIIRGKRRAAISAVIMAFALSLAPLASPLAQAATPPAPAPLVSVPSFAPLIKKVMPAVVNVSVVDKPGAAPGGDESQQQEDPFQGSPQSPFNQMLRHFFQQQQQANPQRIIALGSGFIVDPSGYVVTNNHVIANAAKVTVIFQDGSKHPAKIIGHDSMSDLALLKIDAPKPLPYVTWGNSGVARVGDWVVAVGNPFGLGGTVSPGTIAARSRDLDLDSYDDFLQIDAAINRGNSGGPTFNLAGQVIGINTAIYSPNGGSVGIGFAIPSDLAKPIIEQLKEHGKVTRGWLGVQIQQVTPEIAKSLGLPKDEGALVADVTANSPASRVGFKQGDVILSFDGHDIKKMRDLPRIVGQTPVGKKAEVKVWRQHHEVTLTPQIALMPAHIQLAENGQSGQQSSAMGLQLAPLTGEWHERLHIGKDVRGVVVTGVSNDSPLADLGLQRGDVIESVNQHPTTTPQEVFDLLKKAKDAKGNENVLILLNRNGVNQYVALSLSHQGNG